ncbi:MAG: CatB-related O-acetyltransferase [Eubacteriaceae bacterium]|jgi:virginiamycin A acetyltransferase|nr:CatB-related O-acetyltransferase [Eubacteriaceae bacterium]
MEYGPDPNAVFPNRENRNIVFVKNVITRPNIEVGDYTYYEDDVHPERFEEHVTYHYEELGDRLIIGKFCSIGRGVEFMMNGANQRLDSTTSYPFHLMGHGWEKAVPTISDIPYKGDTVIENDVWIGENVTVLPGTHICSGAVIGANSTVSGLVPPYWIVAGNPSEFIRRRFDAETIESLLDIRWWDWPPERIFDNLEDLCRV